MYDHKPTDKIAVFALYGDSEFEIRATVENAFATRWKQQGIQASPGYRLWRAGQAQSRNRPFQDPARALS